MEGFHIPYDEFYVLFQACIALLLGGFLGYEREIAGKWAGLRTHMLVCLAAMLFIKVGGFLIQHSESDITPAIMRADPVRIIEAIVTGVAFLGAGTIFRDTQGKSMRGLTTAASLLVVAPIGIAVAIERYVLAVGTTLLVWIILHLLGNVEKRTWKSSRPTGA